AGRPALGHGALRSPPAQEREPNPALPPAGARRARRRGLKPALSVHSERSSNRADRPFVSRQQPGFLVASPDPTALGRSGSHPMTTPTDPSTDPARIDRGKPLKRTGAIALGTSLFSFGDPLTVLAAPMKQKALTPDGDLDYFNWAQYIDPKLLRGFEK